MEMAPAMQAVEALAHIAGRGAEIDPHTGRQVHHARSRSTLKTCSQSCGIIGCNVMDRRSRVVQPDVAPSLPEDGISRVLECADYAIARNASRHFHAASSGINSSLT